MVAFVQNHRYLYRSVTSRRILTDSERATIYNLNLAKLRQLSLPQVLSRLPVWIPCLKVLTDLLLTIRCLCGTPAACGQTRPSSYQAGRLFPRYNSNLCLTRSVARRTMAPRANIKLLFHCLSKVCKEQ